MIGLPPFFYHQKQSSLLLLLASAQQATSTMIINLPKSIQISFILFDCCECLLYKYYDTSMNIYSTNVCLVTFDTLSKKGSDVSRVPLSFGSTPGLRQTRG